MVQNTSRIDGSRIALCVDRFRKARPHVHCITNTVAQHFTANVLLAAGGTPSMTIAKEEVAAFVTMADALLVNLGTMDEQRSSAVKAAVATAKSLNKPWALDPVFVQASPIRLRLAKQLLAQSPNLVRCNTGEAEALFDQNISIDTLNQLATHSATIIALTGKSDIVSSSLPPVSIHNGSAVMAAITAMGCALTGLIAGFLAVEDDNRLATVSAIVFFGLAGELAETASRGPGTFVPHFLDALSNLSRDEISTGAKLQ